MATCKLCGAPHASCGPAAAVIPVDARMGEGRQTVGLREYEVPAGKKGEFRTTVLLSDEDARKRGLLEDDAPAEKAAPQPRNKQAPAPKNKRGLFGRHKDADDASDPDASE